jgi:hypothetical protein
MIVAEFTFQSPRLTRVYDTITGADLAITHDVQAMALQASYGAASEITIKHGVIDVCYEIKESK